MIIPITVEGASLTALERLYKTTVPAAITTKFQATIAEQLAGIVKQQIELSRTTIVDKYKTLSATDQAAVDALITSKAP